MVWRYKLQYTDKTLTLRKCMYEYMRASGASELRKFWHFHTLKLQFPSIFLSVHQILCRYKWHACRHTCTDKFPNVPTNFQMYRQNSETVQHYWGGGAVAPPPPPSGYANVLQAIVQNPGPNSTHAAMCCDFALIEEDFLAVNEYSQVNSDELVELGTVYWTICLSQLNHAYRSPFLYCSSASKAPSSK